jgi:hypothetical protein
VARQGEGDDCCIGERHHPACLSACPAAAVSSGLPAAVGVHRLPVPTEGIVLAVRSAVRF